MPTQFKKFERLNLHLHEVGEGVGNMLVDGFHMLGLFAIGGTIVWAALVAFFGMVSRGVATIDDILLLFIYLELGAMVGIYFKTNRMPVRFLIYVAMTALTRLMFGFVTVEHEADTRILIVAGGILVLALAVLIIRIGSSKFPSAGNPVYDNPH
jgi:phosphate starvation-inducible membrane PsiE